ncbi:MAG: helix-turn-helix transcriptional regulator [Peptostreptococcaceae bacterium]|nr:helix-turn-helix transcriptional regulator [Peptostreptococcaceae bacterium]
MRIQEATVYRINELIKNSNLTPNGLSYVSGVPQATIKSILNGESKNPGITTIKKLCDGLDVSITDFFNNEVFNNLDQEFE